MVKGGHLVTFLHTMFPFERANGIVKGYVHNKAHPGLSNKECISFYKNVITDDQALGLPLKKHIWLLHSCFHLFLSFDFWLSS